MFVDHSKHQHGYEPGTGDHGKQNNDNPYIGREMGNPVELEIYTVIKSNDKPGKAFKEQEGEKTGYQSKGLFH